MPQAGFSSILLSLINDAIYQPTFVVADIKGAIEPNSQANRPAAGRSGLFIQPARSEVLNRSLQLSIRERQANYLVACGHASVPGTMVGDEKIALIFCWKGFACIEDEAQRRRMSLQLRQWLGYVLA